MYQYKQYTQSMSGYYGTWGHGRMHLEAELVVGWNRGLRLCTQRAAAVFMVHFDFPTNAGRVHNKPNSLYIPMAVPMCNESAGVKPRYVHRWFFNGCESTGTADSIREGCGHAPPAARHEPAAPF